MAAGARGASGQFCSAGKRRLFSFAWEMAPMPAHRKEIAPALVAEGRRLYEQTMVPVREIAALCGVSPTTLQDRIVAWGWQRRRYDTRSVDFLIARRAAAKPGAPEGAAPSALPPALPPTLPQDRAAVAARVQEVVERELTAVERVLDVLGPSDRDEAERTARTLASLARTLREVALINRTEEAAVPDDVDDDPIPRDINEFRRELARRIRNFIEARRNGAGRLRDERESALG
jgi:hypothetical protein